MSALRRLIHLKRVGCYSNVSHFCEFFVEAEKSLGDLLLKIILNDQCFDTVPDSLIRFLFTLPESKELEST